VSRRKTYILGQPSSPLERAISAVVAHPHRLLGCVRQSRSAPCDKFVVVKIPRPCILNSDARSLLGVWTAAPDPLPVGENRERSGFARTTKRKDKNMKTPHVNLIPRSPFRLGLLLIPLGLACFALLPQGQATCVDGCNNGLFNVWQGDDALISASAASFREPLPALSTASLITAPSLTLSRLTRPRDSLVGCPPQRDSRRTLNPWIRPVKQSIRLNQ